MPGLNGEVHVILFNAEDLPLAPGQHMVELRPDRDVLSLPGQSVDCG
jgi:hypothetical protein